MTILVNPQAGGMAVARPYGFELFSRGHFKANDPICHQREI